jgi:hypothetical protein
LAEFNLAGGVNQRQTFYDISLVDGYNIPVGIVYIPAPNTTHIPPNLTNCACIATPGMIWTNAKSGTVYSNGTYPIPWESAETANNVRDWCPWDLLAFPPSKPGDGVYPYPDDNVYREDFSPCKSMCAATNDPKECCTGEYHDPNVCKASLYSRQAKAVCPDAYSFAFDDQTSTFIIPSGGGWEIIYCPSGRSTNILRRLGNQMFELASAGALTAESVKLVKNVTFIETNNPNGAAGLVPPYGGILAMAMVVIWLFMDI